MKSSEIREKFLKYFESKGHQRLPGSSLIPADPTVLLTLAGMLQFKPIFLGQEKPRFKRVTTVQKCVRMIDLENVGQTARHQTFFEMLGNFSFGDYFKKEAIAFAWEFLTKELRVPPVKLSVAVFEKDDEAYDIWLKEMGLPKEKLFRLDEENNFWAVGPTGPCGPCSEIYYDLGPEKGCAKPDCQPGCDCDRFLEVWNLVFIQYDRNEAGELIPLKQKGIDTGMGLERIASVMQGVGSNFDTDLFTGLIEKIRGRVKIENSPESTLRIIADHIRAITHLISDGVIPGNAGREYVLRRLVRRALRFGKILGINKPFLYLLAGDVIKELGSVYPNLEKNKETIVKVIKAEEENFLQTLEQGLALFNQVIAEHSQDKNLPGEVIFKLHDTFGFPYELSKEMAGELGFAINEKEFNCEMEKQRERARSAGISGDNKKAKVAKIDYGQTRFDGYTKTSEAAKIKAVLAQEKMIVCDHTPFYAESGGQVGDTGIISYQDQKLRVLDTLVSPAGSVVHLVDGTGDLKEKEKVTLTVDLSKRQATEAHHTATHLLHKALREVLGEQVKQAGSYVGPEKLRFDFSHFSALTSEQLCQVESIVNQKIKEKLKVEVMQKSFKDAQKMGAMALFGEKYGDKVRVLKIGDYSLELCGGTHVKSTADIIFFKVQSESALGSGVRRIEAIAGQAAKINVVYCAKSTFDEVRALVKEYKKLEAEKAVLGGKRFSEMGIFTIEVTEIDRLAKAVDAHDSVNVKTILEHLYGRLDWLKERIAKTEREVKELKLKSAVAETSDLSKEIVGLAGVKVLIKGFEGYTMEVIRQLSDQVAHELKSCVILLASVLDARVIFLIKVTPDLIAKGYSAKKIAEVFTSLINGKGGGRDDKVEGGGSDSAMVAEALKRVTEFLRKE